MNRSEAGKLGAKAALPTIKSISTERRRLYNLNPRLCALCSTPISFGGRLNRKFCSRRCAGTVNGSVYVKRARTQPRCEKCGKIHNNKGMLCRFHTMERRIESGLVHSRPILRKWLISKFGAKCAICAIEKWLGQPAPLEIDHMDGNPTNDLPDNLRMVCPNCHAMMPTSKGRNRGNGRTVRGLR